MKIKSVVMAVMMTVFALLIMTTATAQAATLKQGGLNGKVYIVSYLNANALRTSYQYVFFTPTGRVASVAVADVDADGKPLVTDNASVTEQEAPAKIKKMRTDRVYRNRQAKKNLVKVQANNKVALKLNGLASKPAGKIEKGGSAQDFTVTYQDGTQKYTSVHFKQAPAQYQYK